jgi:hypothetical protein
MPDTVADRSITVRMARKTPDDRIERFRVAKLEPEGHAVRDRFAVWTRTAELPPDPPLPDELDDRAQDCWEPLLAIADAAGGDWGQRARHAALILSEGRSEPGDSLGVRLLSDIRQVYETSGAERMTSADLLAGLKELDESPWGTLNDGQPMKPVKLAGLLKPYGVFPAQHRFGEKTAKGYLREHFVDAWSRYLHPYVSSSSPAETKQEKHSCKERENEEKQGTLESARVSPKKPVICGYVADVSDRSAMRDQECALAEPWTVRI